MATFLTAASPRATQPVGAEVKLWPHQLAMLRRCVDAESRVARTPNAVGVIGDVAGAGKTFVVIALAMSRPGCTVVVVPHNIYGQWRDAIERFAPTLRYAMIADYSSISSLYAGGEALIKDNDLLLVTSLYYSSLASTLSTVKDSVTRVVFDEVDSIVDTLRFKIPADMLWLMSATVHTLAVKGVLKAGAYEIPLALLQTCRCEPEFVAASTALDPPIEHVIVSDSDSVDILASVMTGPELTAVNTYDYSHISTEVASSDEALAHLKDSLTADVAECTEEIRAAARPGSRLNIDKFRERLNEAASKLNSMKKAEVAVLSAAMDRLSAGPAAEGAYGTRSDCDKVDNALLVIARRRAEDAHARFIVFSSSPRVLTDIQAPLEAGGVTCAALDGGNADAIDTAARSFKTGETPILMVDSTLFGAGMDFPHVTDVLILHALPDDLLHQVIGRAQRPGRTSTLRVYQFLHPNEK
jgi:superfamily II DNA or RNA helicase